MIVGLEASNFLLFRHLTIDFAEGLTVITGETGAGKSMVLSMLSWCFGYSNIDFYSDDSVEVSVHIQCKFDSALVVAVREVLLANEWSLTEANEVLTEDSRGGYVNLYCKRVADSKSSRCYFNHQFVSKKLMSSLGKQLVQLNTQHAQMDLFQPSRYRLILDQFAGLTKSVEQYKQVFGEWQSAEKAYQQLVKEQEQLANEVAYLTHAIADIESAGVIPNELQSLELERRAIKHNQRLKQDWHSVESMIHSEDGLGSRLYNLTKATGRIQLEGPLWEEFNQLLDTLVSSVDQLESLTTDLSKSLVVNESRLAEVEERIFLLKELLRKYNCLTEQQLIQFYDSSVVTVKNYNHQTETVSELVSRKESLRLTCESLAAELSRQRLSASQELTESIHTYFESLHLNAAVFKVELAPKPLSIHGIDEVLFLIKTNLGQPFSPLHEVLSGGEVSRIFLSLMLVFMDKIELATVVFDEIDQGMSGVVSFSIAKALKTLSQKTQVFTTTHSPQIAGSAHHHLWVKKQHSLENQSTTSIAHWLDLSSRINELARMISGDTITEQHQKSAKELLGIV